MTVPPTPAQPSPKPPVVRTGISGRMLSDGQPIRFFGVTITHNFTFAGIYSKPTPVRTKDGHFTVAIDEPGTWDVIIAGPGFARRVLPGQQIEDGKVLDLGDIAVDHGHLIQGVVRDETGAAVSGARVNLVAGGPEGHGDELRQLAMGNIVATTDSNGHYRIDGAAPIVLGSGRSTIHATSKDAASLPVNVPDADSKIDLTLSPTGSIAVTVNGPVDSFVIAFPIGSRATSLLGRRRDGVFTFDSVPVGDYELQLLPDPASASQRVSVTAGAVTTTTIIAQVSPPVALTVRYPGGSCRTIELSLPGDADPLLKAPCASGEATFPSVSPGHYVICAASPGTDSPRCSLASVEPVPTAQTFDITPNH